MNRKSYPLVLLLTPPLFYFHLHSKPTIHILLFYPFLILLVGFGLKVSFKKKAVKFLTFGLILFLSLVNFLNIRKFYHSDTNLAGRDKWAWGFYNDPELLKAVSYVIRKNSDCGDKIFSNLDGVQVNFYTGLPEKKADEASFMIVDHSFNTQKTDQIAKSNFSYKITLFHKEDKTKIELYSHRPVDLATGDAKVLSQKFSQEFNRAKDVFPNIYCQNY